MDLILNVFNRLRKILHENDFIITNLPYSYYSDTLRYLYKENNKQEDVSYKDINVKYSSQNQEIVKKTAKDIIRFNIKKREDSPKFSLSIDIFDELFEIYTYSLDDYICISYNNPNKQPITITLKVDLFYRYYSKEFIDIITIIMERGEHIELTERMPIKEYITFLETNTEYNTTSGEDVLELKLSEIKTFIDNYKYRFFTQKFSVPFVSFERDVYIDNLNTNKDDTILQSSLSILMDTKDFDLDIIVKSNQLDFINDVSLNKDKILILNEYISYNIIDYKLYSFIWDSKENIYVRRELFNFHVNMKSSFFELVLDGFTVNANNKEILYKSFSFIKQILPNFSLV